MSKLTLSDGAIKRVLYLIAFYEIDGSVFWHCDLTFFISCSDAFFWGTADAEVLRESDIDDFEQALKDADGDGPLLYCARRRDMRPQGAMYTSIDREHWSLFDACGPQRDAGFGNPQAQPV